LGTGHLLREWAISRRLIVKGYICLSIDEKSGAAISFSKFVSIRVNSRLSFSADSSSLPRRKAPLKKPMPALARPIAICQLPAAFQETFPLASGS
jgi:hypothetical protein